MQSPLGFPLTLAALLGLAAWVLWRHAWRALLCLSPASLRLEVEAPAAGVPLPTRLQAMAEALEGLGFVALGTHRESAPLVPARLVFDYCQPTDRLYASLSQEREGKAALVLLTRTEGEHFAVTANQRRPATELPGRYVSGALEDAGVERLVKAHQRVAASLGPPVARCDLEGFLEARRAWFEGPGRRELRLQHLHGLLWTLGTLGIVGAALLGKR